jgi:hypothetical protein
LHRVSNTSFDWEVSDDKKDVRCSKINRSNHSSQSIKFRYQSSSTHSTTIDTSQAVKRRTSAQVTRMLLAVTLSLIILNIPNTIIFLLSKIYDTRVLLIGRSCLEVSENDIKLYKIGFYSSVIQDILSDLTHIVNFFLYCLAGKKFRSILLNEVEHFLVELHLIKRKQRCFTHNGNTLNPEYTNPSGVNWQQRGLSSREALLQSKRSINVFFNSTTNQSILCCQNYKLTMKGHDRYHKVRTYLTIK